MAALETYSHPPARDTLDAALGRVSTRVRALRLLQGGARGLAAALVLDILLAVMSRAGTLSDSPLFLITLAVLAALGICTGMRLAARAAFRPMDAARLAEARLPLKERLSSALEFEGVLSVNPFFALQHADAETHARTLDTQSIVPLRAPRELWAATILLIVLILTLSLPNLPFAMTSTQRSEREQVQAAGRELARAAHTAAQQAKATHQPEAQRRAEQMERLGKRMVQGHMDRAQALAAVSQQEQHLAETEQSGVSDDPGQQARNLAGADGLPKMPSVHTPPKPTPSVHPVSPHTPTAPAAKAGAQAGPKASATNKPSASISPSRGQAAQGRSQSSRSSSNSSTSDTSGQPSSAEAGTPRATGDGSKPGQSSPTSQSAAGMQHALEDARRRLAGSGASSGPASAKPASGASSQAGISGHPSSSSAGATGSSSAASHGVSTPGKSSEEQGKPGGQSVGRSGGASGQSASGGGGTGQAAKAPFHSALPPTLPGKSQSIYLGAPEQSGSRGASLPKRSVLPASPAGTSRVPYGQALPAYRKSAETALDQDHVPPSQRAVVRDYFNSLQPAK